MQFDCFFEAHAQMQYPTVLKRWHQKLCCFLSRQELKSAEVTLPLKKVCRRLLKELH